MSEQVKLCVDCKHAKVTSNPYFSKCIYPQEPMVRFNIVHGKTEETVLLCLHVRNDEDRCGEDARWFELVNPETPIPSASLLARPAGWWKNWRRA